MIVLSPWIDLHAYVRLVAAPLVAMTLKLRCDRCGSDRLHGHGFYEWKAFVAAEEGVFELVIRRMLCVACGHAPSVVPAFAANRLRAEDAAVASAAARYVDGAAETYRSVAAGLEVAHSTMWRWVERIAAASLGAVLALLVRARPDADPLRWLPKRVSNAQRKGRSAEKRKRLLSALQVLVAGHRLAEVCLPGMRRLPTLRFVFPPSHMTQNMI